MRTTKPRNKIKVRILMLTLILSSSQIFAKGPTLFLKLDPNLCINCYAVMSQIKKVSDKFDIVVNIPGYSEREINSFVSNIIKLENFKSIQDEALSARNLAIRKNQYLITDSSGVELLQGSTENIQLLVNIYLKNEVPKINITDHFEDSLDLGISRRSRIICQNDDIFILDGFYDKLFRVSPKGADRIDLSSHAPEIYKEIYGNLQVYEQVKKIKNDFSSAVILKILYVQQRGDSLVFLTAISDLVKNKDKKNTIILRQRRIIINYHNDKILSIKKIKNIPDKLAVGDHAFVALENKFIFALPSTELKKINDDYQYLGIFEGDSAEIKYLSRLENIFPEQVFKDYIFTSTSIYFDNYPLITILLAPYLIIANDKSYFIDKYEDYFIDEDRSKFSLKFNFKNLDSYLYGNKIISICLYNDQIYLDRFMIENGELIQQFSINLSHFYPGLYNLNGTRLIQFYDSKNILSLSKGSLVDIILPSELLN